MDDYNLFAEIRQRRVCEETCVQLSEELPLLWRLVPGIPESNVQHSLMRTQKCIGLTRYSCEVGGGLSEMDPSP